MKICTERNGKMVCITFLIASACGWSVFLLGLGKLLSSIKIHKEDHPTIDTSGLVKGTTGPMWLFAVSGALLYPTLAMQIFKSRDNLGHILHCITILFNFFYTSGGVLSMSLGLLFQSKSIRPLLILTLPDEIAMKMILIGAVIALAHLWVGLGIRPLFKIRRQRYNGYTELQDNSIQYAH